MAIMNMVEALNSAHRVLMEKYPNVIVFGQDAGYFGGVFNVTEGLQKEFGKQRCFDAPISECGIVGAAIGMAANDLRPLVEIQFADYIYPAYDQIVSEAARLRFRSAGMFTCPLTIRTPYGGGVKGGQTHSQSPESLFTHVSGLQVVIPSNPYDAKGLLIASVEKNDPVIFFEPKRIYNGPFNGDPHSPAVSWDSHRGGEVPEDYYTIELGKANIVKEGSDITIIVYGTMVHVAEAAVEVADIDAEIIDLRTLLPLDNDTIINSVKKTKRCVIVHEATLTSGFGAELAAIIQKNCFWHLKAPVERITGWDVPYPLSFEWDYFPTKQRVADTLKNIMQEG